MSLSYFDQMYAKLMSLGFSEPAATFTTMGVGMAIVLLVMVGIGFGVRALFRKLTAPPAGAERFNHAEKKENFPSMAELAARAQKAASDAVAGAKKMVGA